MSLDLDRLTKALDEMGYSVEFNSDTPGFENDDKSITKFDELSLVYKEFLPIQQSYNVETTRIEIDRKENNFSIEGIKKNYRYNKDKKRIIIGTDNWRLAC